MIIIGVDFHPEFQQIAFERRTPESFWKSGLRIAQRRRSSSVRWQRPATRCVSAWKPAGNPACGRRYSCAY